MCSCLNHIFKVIWNQARNCYVAVSEMASSKSSTNLKPNKIQTAVMAALAAMSLSQTAIAADPIDDANVDNPAGTTISGLFYGVRLDRNGPYTIDNAGEIGAELGSRPAGIDIFNSVTVTSINNTSTGVIKADATSGGQAYGINMSSAASVGTLINAGLISGSAAITFGRGIHLTSSNIETLTNSGRILGVAGGSRGTGLFASQSTITTLTNTGTISGSASGSLGKGYGIYINNFSDVDTLNNSGTISAASGNGHATAIFLTDTSTVSTLINTGLITADSTGIKVYGISIGKKSAITTLINEGTIRASVTSAGGGKQKGVHGINMGGLFFDDRSQSSIDTLTNNGSIIAISSGTSIEAYGLYMTNKASIETFNNNALISASAANQEAYGIYFSQSSSITTLTNSGTITAQAGNSAIGLYIDTGSIETLTNSGLISAIATVTDDEGDEAVGCT